MASSKEMCKGVRESIIRVNDKMTAVQDEINGLLSGKAVEPLVRDLENVNKDILKHERRVDELKNDVAKMSVGVQQKNPQRLLDEMDWTKAKINEEKKHAADLLSKINDFKSGKLVDKKNDELFNLSDELVSLSENELYYCNERGTAISAGSPKKRR